MNRPGATATSNYVWDSLDFRVGLEGAIVHRISDHLACIQGRLRRALWPDQELRREDYAVVDVVGVLRFLDDGSIA